MPRIDSRSWMLSKADLVYLGEFCCDDVIINFNFLKCVFIVNSISLLVKQSI